MLLVKQSAVESSVSCQ